MATQPPQRRLPPNRLSLQPEEELPAWLQEAEVPAAYRNTRRNPAEEKTVIEQVEPLPVEELPAWLQEAEVPAAAIKTPAESLVEEKTVVQQVEPLPVEELPAWFQEAELPAAAPRQRRVRHLWRNCPPVEEAAAPQQLKSCPSWLQEAEVLGCRKNTCEISSKEAPVVERYQRSLSKSCQPG